MTAYQLPATPSRSGRTSHRATEAQLLEELGGEAHELVEVGAAARGAGGGATAEGLGVSNARGNTMNTVHP